MLVISTGPITAKIIIVTAHERLSNYCFIISAKYDVSSVLKITTIPTTHISIHIYSQKEWRNK